MSKKNLFKPISLESLGKTNLNEKECSDYNTKPSSISFLPKEEIISSKPEITFEFTPVPKIQTNIKEISPSNNIQSPPSFENKSSSNIESGQQMEENKKNETNPNVNQEEKNQIDLDEKQPALLKQVEISPSSTPLQDQENKKLLLSEQLIKNQESKEENLSTLLEIKPSQEEKQQLESIETELQIIQLIKEENHSIVQDTPSIEDKEKISQDDQKESDQLQDSSLFIESIQNDEIIKTNDDQVSDLSTKEDTRKILSSSQKKKQKR